MLVIAILKIDERAAPGAVTFTGRRERAVQGTRSSSVPWQRSHQLASSRRKVPGAPEQLPGTAPSDRLAATAGADVLQPGRRQALPGAGVKRAARFTSPG